MKNLLALLELHSQGQLDDKELVGALKARGPQADDDHQHELRSLDAISRAGALDSRLSQDLLRALRQAQQSGARPPAPASGCQAADEATRLSPRAPVPREVSGAAGSDHPWPLRPARKVEAGSGNKPAAKERPSPAGKPAAVSPSTTRAFYALLALLAIVLGGFALATQNPVLLMPVLGFALTGSAAIRKGHNPFVWVFAFFGFVVLQFLPSVASAESAAVAARRKKTGNIVAAVLILVNVGFSLSLIFK